VTRLALKSSEQQSAEAGVEVLGEFCGPFVVAAETTRMAMVFTDAKQADNPLIFANDAFLQLTGYSRNEVMAQSFSFFMADAADKEAQSMIDIEFQGGAKSGTELLYRRKDGSEFWCSVFVSPVRDEKGKIIQYFASFVDTTPQKTEKLQMKQLINELNHRVKNTLATVQSIVRHALRSAVGPVQIGKNIEARLMALSRSHDLLTRGNWKNAGLHDIVRDALEPFIFTNGSVQRIHMDGSNLLFAPRAALALSIAFNELATNAVKYGALSNETGSVDVRWARSKQAGSTGYVLKWRESGGPPVEPATHDGFGSGIIKRSLAQVLDGEVHVRYAKEGLECTIEFPEPHRDTGE
jgi:PAS domain S-box-containing protein